MSQNLSQSEYHTITK